MLISICIPTYNRYNELKKLLKILEEQIKRDKLYKEVEICISDNGTEKINGLIEYYKKFLNLKYNKNLENKGFDYNLQKVSELATGKYIWFCGDDDIIKENGIKKILDNIKKIKGNLYILNGEIYKGKKKNNLNALKAENAKVYNTIEGNEIVEYINDIRNNLSFYCAFITAIVIERELYNEIKIPIQLENSAYDHTYKLLYLIKKGIKLVYLKDVYYEVGFAENEWTKEDGKHFLLDIESIYKFIKILYPENEGQEIRKAIGKLFYRANNTIQMIFNYEYIKRIKKENEVNKIKEYFYMNSLKEKFLQNYLSTKFSVNILKKIKKIRKKLCIK